MSELKACPFCSGGKMYLTSNDEGSAFKECENCGASGPPASTEAEAIAAWNRRPAAEALVNALDALGRADGFPYLADAEKLQARAAYARLALAAHRSKP